MEKVWKSMENNNNQDYATKILDIYDKMKNLPNWKNISNVYDKLYEQFYTMDDMKFPEKYDTFYKQLKGKGSKKYMKIYFDYLYNLDEVQEELIKKSSSDEIFYLKILLALTIIFLVGINFYFFKDNTFEQLKQTQTIKYKQCMKKCLKI